MTQFKEKSAQQRELTSAGIFLYPVLQAADVLAYGAHEVPVGDDQRQHIELMRDIALRFNATYGETLVVPEHRIPEIGARIMDLQEPTQKMSTTGSTEQGRVYVDDEPDEIRRKFKRAVADSGREIVRAPDKPGISNMIEVLSVVRGSSPDEVEREFDGSGYGDFKAAVAEEVVGLLEPVRSRYLDLRPDEDGLEATLREGAERARAMASETLRDVRRVMGVGAQV
jgi:tryptophanyl-tRNA synthetase